MNKGKRKSAPLIFIDTNIMLDFYRQQKGATTSLLELIDKNRDNIICTVQVEMEFKKHRQRVISDGYKKLKLPEWGCLTPPAFLTVAEPAAVIEGKKGQISKQVRKLQQRINEVARKPSEKDEVYRVLQRLFRSEHSLNLRECESQMDDYKAVIDRAKERYFKGYPPRKSDDTSMGDAINWEWIVTCASRVNSNVVIVSRDSDYGTKINGDTFANDWLQQEFKSRVNKQKKVIVTELLSEAFALMHIQVPKPAKEQEENLLEEKKQALESIESGIPNEKREPPAA